jgi:hypothetical protein
MIIAHALKAKNAAQAAEIRELREYQAYLLSEIKRIAQEIAQLQVCSTVIPIVAYYLHAEFRHPTPSLQRDEGDQLRVCEHIRGHSCFLQPCLCL